MDKALVNFTLRTSLVKVAPTTGLEPHTTQLPDLLSAGWEPLAAQEHLLPAVLVKLEQGLAMVFSQKAQPKKMFLLKLSS